MGTAFAVVITDVVSAWAAACAIVATNCIIVLRSWYELHRNRKVQDQSDVIGELENVVSSWKCRFDKLEEVRKVERQGLLDAIQTHVMIEDRMRDEIDALRQELEREKVKNIKDEDK